MSAYTQSLIQHQFKEEKIEQGKDNSKMMLLSILGMGLTAGILAPSLLAQGVAGSTAVAATAATAPPIAMGANAPILGIVEGLSKVSPAALKVTAPLMKMTSMLPQAMQMPVAQGVLKTGVSAGVSAIGGSLLGIKDKQYSFVQNPYDEYANPFSGTNLASGVDAATMWYEDALSSKKKEDELELIRQMIGS